jgi:hypothetical protein
MGDGAKRGLDVSVDNVQDCKEIREKAEVNSTKGYNKLYDFL